MSCGGHRREQNPLASSAARAAIDDEFVSPRAIDSRRPTDSFVRTQPRPETAASRQRVTSFTSSSRRKSFLA